ncbi:MFS polyamine transporter [Pholiota conissans]|uniref:MFS polyamine transporter n=1 Tax=Pholiota conissans TaxID=109636 RepID=A0A9P5Z996_9AGAR|nr:MFS polyamine transporter [Pholiota conissans]
MSHPDNTDQSGPPTVINSTRTSFTYLEQNAPQHEHEQAPDNEKARREASKEQERIDLQEITSRGEEEIERYGGDEPQDPEPKPAIFRVATVPALPKVDPNMVTWDGPGDPENPQNWKNRYKWFVTVICIIMTVNVTFASSAPSSATFSIIAAFDIKREISYLLTTTFLLGYVFGPLIWGPGSEVVGRKPIFVIAMSGYTLFILGQALAQNVETMMVTRFFSGLFAVAPLTNAGGVIVDIWPAVGRGPATSLFTASVFLGPVLGPIISGYIVDSHASWRWVFWVMFIFAGTCTLIMISFLPETYAPVLLQKKTKRLRKADPEGTKHLYAEHEKQDWSFKGLVHRTLFRPFKMLAMEPILVLITIYLAIVYGLLYALFEAFPVIFVVRRHFTIAQDGLIFIGVGIGTTIGSAINLWTSAHYPELIKKWRGFPPPEERLYGAMLGSPLLVVGIFWLGWTGEYASIPWYVPAISTILVGTGISLIFMSFLSYLVDTYLMYAASALSANTVIRSAVAASFPLFTVQMFTNLGVNWACTLIGLLALLFVPAPFLFFKYGALIRTRSTFSPCIDLQIAKLLKEEEEDEKQTSSV